jgi:hypothetical protein
VQLGTRVTIDEEDQATPAPTSEEELSRMFARSPLCASSRPNTCDRPNVCGQPNTCDRPNVFERPNTVQSLEVSTQTSRDDQRQHRRPHVSHVRSTSTSPEDLSMPVLELEPAYRHSMDYHLTSFAEMADIPHRAIPSPALQSPPATFRLPEAEFGPHYSPVSSPEPGDPEHVPDWTTALEPINIVVPSLSQVSVAESLDREAIYKELIPDSFFEEENFPGLSSVSKPLEWRESTLNLADLEELELEPLEPSEASITDSLDLFEPAEQLTTTGYKCLLLEGTPEEMAAAAEPYLSALNLDPPVSFSDTCPTEIPDTAEGITNPPHPPSHSSIERPDHLRNGRLRNPYPLGIDYPDMYCIRRSFPDASPDDLLDFLCNRGRQESPAEWRRAYDRLEATDESERLLATDINRILDQVRPGNVAQQEQALTLIRTLTRELINRPRMAQGHDLFGPKPFPPPPSV